MNNDEIRLIDKLQQQDLSTSIKMLRSAMTDLWTQSPKIVKDFTDHGEQHCGRLASYAKRLLDLIEDQPITELELYVLLAGIYLHDIGMQCDVGKFPEIMKKAESMGATFDIEFKSQSASNYDLNEQIAIRKNHNYLSAAWIDQAFRDQISSGSIGSAIKNIPANLISDIIKVCIFHSGNNFEACPKKFSSFSSERLQLVAAILRMSDELDIDSNRIRFDVIKNFSIDLKNAVYWWLHNSTNISFNPKNAVCLIVNLEPNDYKNHNKIIKELLIDAFMAKNRELISILQDNRIPLVFSSESRVQEDNYAEPMPDEIIKYIYEMAKSNRYIDYELSDKSFHELDNKSLALDNSDQVGIIVPGTQSFYNLSFKIEENNDVLILSNIDQKIPVKFKFKFYKNKQRSKGSYNINVNMNAMNVVQAYKFVKFIKDIRETGIFILRDLKINKNIFRAKTNSEDFYEVPIDLEILRRSKFIQEFLDEVIPLDAIKESTKEIDLIYFLLKDKRIDDVQLNDITLAKEHATKLIELADEDGVVKSVDKDGINQDIIIKIKNYLVEIGKTNVLIGNIEFRSPYLKFMDSKSKLIEILEICKDGSLTLKLDLSPKFSIILLDDFRA
jgi:hypothetical protein